MKKLDLLGCREIENLNVHSKYLCAMRLDDCSSLKKIFVTKKNDKIGFLIKDFFTIILIMILMD